jgi:DNA (cytosine-5)-methyltransferase 1
MRYIDLFCGAGGLSIGFAKAGFHLDFASDISMEAVRTFQNNLGKIHPESSKEDIIHGDIKDLFKFLEVGDVVEEALSNSVFETLRERKMRDLAPSLKSDDLQILKSIKEIDVLVGGPPCQGFSMIGRSKKNQLINKTKDFVDDPRNQLFKYYLKFAEKYKPKIVVIENVRGLNSAEGYRELIRKSLETTGPGYEVYDDLLNSVDFGVPQNRFRLFFIGIRKDLDLSPKLIFEEIEKRKVKPLTVWDAIKDLPKIKANPLPNNYKEIKEYPIEDNRSFGENISESDYNDLVRSSPYTSKINSFNGALINVRKLFNHKSRYHNANDLAIYSKLFPGKYLNDKENKEAVRLVKYGTYIDDNGDYKVKSFEDKYFKLDGNKPSKTIIAHLETDGNSYVHPGEEPRSITPREAARLQSFPDWYKFSGTLRNQFKQIGNAVPPLLAEVIAESIKTVIDNE